MLDSPPTRSSTNDAQAFYGKWARLYDLIASRTPGIRRFRRRVVDSCQLDEGDTVVEFGCGTGANLSYLREAVGADGRVVGIDFTRRVLDQGRRRMRHADNVHLVHGDATTPPLGNDVEIDAVVGTFVVGMLADPGAAVDDWCDLVRAGGRVVLANAARSERWYGPAVNGLFGAIVRVSTPPATRLRYDEDLTGKLDRRITTAHDRLRARGPTSEHTAYLGLVRLTGATVGD